MSHHSNHHLHIDKLMHLKSRLQFFYTHLLIQAFAISLVNIFIPVYLLSIGYSLLEVLLYLLVEWTVFGFFAPLYGRLISRIGLKEVILIRTPLYIFGLILINSLSPGSLLWEYFYLIAIIFGLSGSLYTLSMTSLFAMFLGNKQQSMKTAKLKTYPMLMSIITPAIGGSIALWLGFSVLASLVMVLLFISVLPLLFVKNNLDHPAYRLDVIREIRKDSKEFVFLCIFGMRTFVLFVILPIAIYLFFEDFALLGIAFSVVTLIKALFSLYLGHLVDRFGAGRVIRLGAGIGTLFFFIMGVSFASAFFLGLAIISGIVEVLIDIPYETHLYARSRKSTSSPLEFLVFKEFSLFLGRFVLLAILILFYLGIEWTFYLGALSSLAFVFFG